MKPTIPEKSIVRQSILIMLCLMSFSMAGQVAMERGFTLLESGNFSKAEVFFADVLKELPNDRTALICYGRAVGLNGRPGAANDIFEGLLNQYPEDFEIALNLAESKMWQGDFGTAQQYFIELVQNDAQSFPARLGLANALSSQQQFVEALDNLELALMLQPGNANALISKKYALLGLANELRNSQNFNAAQEKLDTIFRMFPADKDALVSLAELELIRQDFKAAQAIYAQIHREQIAPFAGLKGMSYASLMLGRTNEALQYIDTLLAYSTDHPDLLSAFLLKADILGAQREFEKAFELLDTLEKNFGSSDPIILAHARIKAWTYDITGAEELFKQVMAQDSTNIDAYLGMADALYANGMLVRAQRYIEEVLSRDPDKLDAHRLQQQILRQLNPSVSLQARGFQDNAGNTSIGTEISIAAGKRIPLSPILNLSSTRIRTTDNGFGIQMFRAGFQGMVRVRSRSQVSMGLSVSQWTGDTIPAQFTYHLEHQTRLDRSHSLSLGFKKSYDTYSVDLVRQKLRRNTIYGRYHYTPPAKFGIYSEYLRMFQSDENQRQLFFASGYVFLGTKPVLKTGINATLMTHKFSVPEQYFSPRSYRAIELFVALSGQVGATKWWAYDIQVAAGKQQTNFTRSQYAFRVSANTGFILSRSLQLNAFYRYGNVVEGAVTGYQSQQAGVRLTWNFTPSP